MNLFAPPRHFDPDQPEFIDRPSTDPVLVREEVQILEVANARFGEDQLMLQRVKGLLGLRKVPSLEILDLATGGADIPRVIVEWARQHQVPVTVTAVDNNPEVLRVARESCRDWPEIRIEQHDLLELPFPPNSFDLVLCSLALHHFTIADVIGILRRMQETARVGYIVSDLRRNRLAIWTAELLVRRMVKSPIIRNDAVQSCRAAFTVSELRTMAEQAGLRNFSIHRCQLFFRMILEGTK
ncbi:MAG: methyltransferase domain-containing protein [Chthoniobacteraceae bacterium]